MNKENVRSVVQVTGKKENAFAKHLWVSTENSDVGKFEREGSVIGVNFLVLGRC